MCNYVNITVCFPFWLFHCVAELKSHFWFAVKLFAAWTKFTTVDLENMLIPIKSNFRCTFACRRLSSHTLKQAKRRQQTLYNPLPIFLQKINVDPSHRWQTCAFLQRMGAGLLSVLWPRLASIQGLHLHQSGTKPHGPAAHVFSRQINCDRYWVIRT